MNDTLTPKALALATISGTQLPGSARSYPRVSSVGDNHDRRSTHINSRSPSVIRVAHQPRTARNDVQRSLFGLLQTLSRDDVNGVQLSTVTFPINLQSNIPSGITLAEFRAAASELFGALLANDGELLTAMFNGEY